LSLGGHEVCIAHDGSTVIERVKSFKPDLVLLDLEMPGIDGYKTAKLIRNLPGGNETLLVALMGRGQDEDRRRTREAGFDFHLVKPVEFENLRQILATGKAMPAETGVISADSSPTMLATGEVSGQHTTMFIQAGKNIDSTFLSDQSH
jgi:CheY-like chemotaxis protein